MDVWSEKIPKKVQYKREGAFTEFEEICMLLCSFIWVCNKSYKLGRFVVYCCLLCVNKVANE